MDRALLERLDAFPYRHKVGELMSRPLFTLPGETPLGQAVSQMAQRKVSSCIVLSDDGSAAGIVTEHDVLRQVGSGGAAALERPLSQIMTSPVATVPATALLYVALGRMDRMKVRHLLVVDEEDRPQGMLTARAVLKMRASAALRLGDVIMGAADAGTMHKAHDQLPQLARDLLAESVSAGEVAGVIASVNRDLAARAVELAALAITPRFGPAPVKWCYLVLGSGGRGESLLAPDQDNALVYEGEDETHDAWFKALGEKASELLNDVGIPFCRGGVMASQPLWRGSLERWRNRVAYWRSHPEPEALLAIDIFFDFQPVAGTQSLGLALRQLAEKELGDRTLPRLMAQQLAPPPSPFGLLGNLKGEEGRIDLKKLVLYPIVLGSRILALAKGAASGTTPERLKRAEAAGLINELDASGLMQSFAFAQDMILRQQLDDLAKGRAPDNKVAVERFGALAKRELREAVQRIRLLRDTVEAALAS